MKRADNLSTLPGTTITIIIIIMLTIIYSSVYVHSEEVILRVQNPSKSLNTTKPVYINNMEKVAESQSDSSVISENEIRIDKSLGTILNKSIANLAEETTVVMAKNNISLLHGNLVFTDTDGECLFDNDLLYEGCVITLTDGKGKTVDKVTITGISYSNKTIFALGSKKAQLNSDLEVLKNINISGYEDTAAARITSALNKINEAFEDGNITAGMADALHIKAENAKSIAVVQEKNVRDRENDRIVIYIAVCSVISACALRIKYIRKKKESMSVQDEKC